MDIKKFLETVDKFDFAGEKAGQQPGQQWRGTDKGLPGTKLVGEELNSNVVLIQDPKGQYLDKLDINVAAKKYNFNANYIKQQLQHQDFTQVGNIRVIKPIAAENVMKELEDHVKETSTERKLKRDFDNFDSEDWAEWDAKIKRLKQRAKQGELVTVWDKEKRVYKNVPKSEIKEFQNRQDPDAQTTSPPSPDASQSALDQIQDKIFARDVEGETVEEQTPAAPVVKPFGTPPAQTTTTPPAPAAKPFKFTPDQEKWLGGANRQDPNILARMPGAKPGVDYFKGADDQAIAKQVNVGRSNLNTVKGAVGMQKDAPQVFPTTPAPKPVAPAPAKPAVQPQAAAPAAQTQRPTVVGTTTPVKADPNAYKKVQQQTLKVDAPATASSAPAAPAASAPAPRTTWRSLAKLNPQIKNPDRIYPGQEITLPNGSKAVVNKGDTLSGIAQRYRQGGYADGTPVAPSAPATATSTPVKTPAMPVPQTLPKASGKAAAQLQKGREYRARQTAQQDNTNLGGNAADPESQAFVNPDKPQTQTAKAEPGVTATADVGVGTAGIMGAFGDLKKREDGNWYFPGGVKVTRPSVIAAAEKAAVKTAPAPTATAGTTVKQAEPKTAAGSPTTTVKQPLSVRNNNPGNLRFAGQPGAVRDANGYARFETPEAGRAAMRRQLNLDMQRRGMNLTQALNKYAPPSDNNPTDKYIDFVAQRVGIDPTKPIPKNKMAAIQRAMVEFEGGKRAVDAFYPKRTMVAKAGTTVESLMADYQKFVAEYGNQQNPDAQATSGDTPESDAEAELKRQRMDRRVSQGTLGGLSAVLPPGTNTQAAASGLNKMVDQKPLTPQEQMAVSGIMPLVARAAEEPSTSASLKTALGRAGMLTKLGAK